MPYVKAAGRERGIFPEGDPIVRLYADSIVTQAAE